MKYYKTILNVYVLVKILCTSIYLPLSFFGVFTLPFSISIGLNGGVYSFIARIMILISLLWLVFLIMSLIKSPIANKISRVGIIILSLFDIICLTYSIVMGIRLVRLDNVGENVVMIILRTLAVIINILCILYCNKKLVERLVHKYKRKEC